MKLLSALLMAASLSACALAPRGQFVYSAETAFADACRLSQYDCTGVPAPQLRKTAFGSTFGVYGVYLGGNLVWVDEAFDVNADHHAYAILVHEMVHYLQEVVGRLRPSISLLEVCAKEEEAYRVSNRVLLEVGMTDKVRAFPYDSRCAPQG